VTIRFIAGSWGDHAVDDYGIDPASLAECGDDLDCQDVAFFGGQRHGCDPCTGMCTRFQLEARRIHARPEGLEVVLATNSRDPQAGLLATKRQPAPGSDLICDLERESNQIVPPSDIFSTLSPHDLDVFFAGGTAGAICGHDARSCEGVCGEFGVKCAVVDSLGLAPRGEIPSTSTCNLGCCSPHVACGGDCAHLPTDPSHCGGCDNACAENERCEAGSCVALCR
jgi:hypothetical protein